MSLVVVARFSPKPGQEARVESILRGMVPNTRAEPGCRRYDLYKGVTVAAPGQAGGGATVFCLIERYADAAAIEAHRETAHYKTYRASITELLAAPIEVVRLEALDERT